MTDLHGARRLARGLAGACHPIPTVAVTGLATALAVAVGHSIGRTALIAVAVLAGQLSIGWCNDAVDAERDRTVGRPDKPVARGDLSRRAVSLAAAAALTAAVALSLAVGVVAGLVHLLTVAGGWAYDLGLKRTTWSWLPYTVAFGALPSFVVLALPGQPTPPWWLALSGGLLGVAAHLANVLPDLEHDAATGVRGFPHRLGAGRAIVVAAAALAFTSAILCLAPPGAPSPAQLIGGSVGVLGAVGLLVAGRPAPHARMLFLGVLVLAGVDVVLLVVGGTTF